MFAHEAPPKSRTFWFLDISNTALLCCVGTILVSISPAWRLAQIVTAATAPWWEIPVGILALPLGAILPVFYFALSRSRNTFRFPPALQNLATGAAIVSTIVLTLFLLPEWYTSFRAWLPPFLEWIRAGKSLSLAFRSPSTIGELSSLLNVLSIVTYIQLLTALSRQSGDFSEQTPISSFLRRATSLAVIFYGTAVSLVLLRLLFIYPIYVYLVRTLSIPNHATPPPFSNLLKEATLTFLSQACILVAPLVIFLNERRLRRTVAIPEPPAETPVPSPSDL